MLISFAIKCLRPTFVKSFSNAKFAPTATLIKKLREETGSPINECKVALEIHEGNLEQAKEHLKAKGMAQASKRFSKTAQEGVIGVSMSEDRQFSVISEVNCETDFVARTDLFKNFVLGLLQTVSFKKTSLNLADISDEVKTQEGITNFLSQSQLILSNPLFPEDISTQSLSILDSQKLIISKLQENVKIRRILTFSQTTPGFIGSYVHNTQIDNIGNSACLLNLESSSVGKGDSSKKIIEFADNLAMQILGTKPRFLYRKDMPNEILEEEKNRIKKEMEKAIKGKPDHIVETIIEGKLKKFYEDNVLMDMEFILEGDGGANVKDYISKVEQSLGAKFALKQYHLWTMGQK